MSKTITAKEIKEGDVLAGGQVVYKLTVGKITLIRILGQDVKERFDSDFPFIVYGTKPEAVKESECRPGEWLAAIHACHPEACDEEIEYAAWLRRQTPQEQRRLNEENAR